MTRNCCYCRYFSEEIRENGADVVRPGIGDCRVNPPDGTAKPFPLVRDLDWCGEWADGNENHPPQPRLEEPINMYDAIVTKPTEPSGFIGWLFG